MTHVTTANSIVSDVHIVQKLERRQVVDHKQTIIHRGANWDAYKVDICDGLFGRKQSSELALETKAIGGQIDRCESHESLETS